MEVTMGKAWKAFESRIAKYLESIYKDEKLKFGRVPCSGAMASRNTNFSGDVYCINDDKFPYFIECKERKDLSLWGLLREQKKNQIEDWFNKAKKQALKVEKTSVLFITRLGAGFPDLVVCEYAFEMAEMNFETMAKSCIIINDANIVRTGLYIPSLIIFPRNGKKNIETFKTLFPYRSVK